MANDNKLNNKSLSKIYESSTSLKKGKIDKNDYNDTEDILSNSINSENENFDKLIDNNFYIRTY